MNRQMPLRRPNGSKTIPPRSIRIPDSEWEMGRRRAEREGLTISRVVTLLVEGYGRGYIDTPRLQKTYGAQRRATVTEKMGE